MAAADGEYEGGGIGGKFQRMPFRRAAATTPYERPLTADRTLRSRTGPTNRRGWISKIVDPASRLISSSASMFFASVFRKRLGAPPPHSSPQKAASIQESQVTDTDQRDHASDDVPAHDGVTYMVTTKENAGAAAISHNPPLQHDGVTYMVTTQEDAGASAISQLERLLKQKTFTRAEHDRLVDLLQSRTVDLLENEIRTEPLSLSAQDGKQENLRGISKVTGSITGTSPTKMDGIMRVPEEEDASPTELAKVYMGSRPSQVASPAPSLGYTTKREATTLRNTEVTLSQSKKSAVSLSFSCHGEEGYRIPRTRGRTAIYKMAQSPYFKAQKVDHFQGTEPNDKDSALPTSEHCPYVSLSSGKQVLKRSSSFVDNDSVTFGSARRVRQRFNMSFPLKENLLSSEKYISNPHVNDLQGYSTPVQKPLLTSELNHDIVPLEDVIGDVYKSSSASFASVPQQSSLMARKILQQLDHIVPSSKEKLSKIKEVTDNGSPCKLTLNMLNGQALKSMNNLDSSKNLRTDGDIRYSGSVALTRTSSIASAAEVQFRIKNNVVLEQPISGGKELSEVVRLDDGAISVTNKDNGAATGNKPVIAAGDVPFSSSAVLTPKKPSFRMQVPESSWELDSDNYSFVVASDHKCDEKERSILSSTEANHKTITEMLPHDSSKKRLDIGSSIKKESVNGVAFGTKSIKKGNVSNFSLASPVNVLSHIPPPSLTEDNVPKMDEAFAESVSIRDQHFSQSISHAEQSSSLPTSKKGPAFIYDHKTTSTISLSSNAIDSTSVKIGTSLESKPVFLGSTSSTLLMNQAEIFSHDKDKETGISRESHILISPGSQTCASIASGSSNGTSNLTASQISLPITSVSPLSVSPLLRTTFSAIPSMPLQENGYGTKTISTGAITLSVSKCEREVERASKESSFGTISFSVSPAAPSLSKSGSSLVGSNASVPAVVSSSSGETGSGISFVTQSIKSQFMSSDPSSTASPSFGFTGSVIGSSKVVATPFSFGSNSNTQQTLTCNSSLSSSRSQPAAASIFSFGFTSAPGKGSLMSSSASLSSSNSSSSLSFMSPASSSIFSSNSQNLVPSIFSPGLASGTGESSSMSFTACVPAPSPSSSLSLALCTSGSSILSSSSQCAEEASLFGSGVASGCVPGSSISFGASAFVSKSSSNSSLVSSSSSSSLFSFSSQAASTSIFGSGFTSSSGQNSPVSFGANIFSSSGSSSFASTLTSSSLFNSSTQPVASSIFGSGSSVSSLSPGFSFGLSSASAANAPLSFGSSSAPFSFSAGIRATTSSSPSPSLAPVTFGASMPVNDQMNDDSMTDDTVQTTPIVSPFGQETAPSIPSVPFGSPALQQGGATGFQFGNQMSSVFTQAQSSFQAGGSFSLGSGGGDKSSRRFVKVKRDKHRKK